MKVLLVDAPEEYFDWLEMNITDQLCGKNETPELVHLFVLNYKTFEAAMKKLEPSRKKYPAITIWVSWYKKAAGIPTDLTEDVIRDYALKHNLVDVKVCAVSEQWSGLKLVVPLKKRV